jgi:exonuclease VII large subunit
MNDIPLTLFSGGAIAATTILVTFFTWLANRTMAHGSQIKNLGDKIDHAEDKMDRGFKHLEDKIDSAIKYMDEKMSLRDEKMNIQDKESKERISRLEKYFDIIMQTQIKKNKDRFSMEE